MSISIHALREESDIWVGGDTHIYRFQSTLSVRRATTVLHGLNRWIYISIHALREESDMSIVVSSSRWHPFQSTLSVRRATT